MYGNAILNLNFFSFGKFAGMNERSMRILRKQRQQSQTGLQSRKFSRAFADRIARLVEKSVRSCAFRSRRSYHAPEIASFRCGTSRDKL